MNTRPNSYAAFSRAAHTCSRGTLLVAFALSAASSPCQTPSFTLPEPTGAYACAGVGDVDRDGVPDFAVGSDGRGTGKVTVYSGRYGTMLFQLLGGNGDESFGLAVADAGDVDRDGFADILVGEPYEATGSSPGKAEVYSGRDQRLLRSHQGGLQGDTFGICVANAGDLDGDHVPDQLVGASQQWNGLGGYVKVMSGAVNNVTLRVFVNPQAGERFGCSCSVIGDVDGRGQPDFAIGNRYGGLARRGTVSVYSFETGLLIYQPITGSSPNDELGTSVCAVGDVNNDGRPDYAAGAEGTPTTKGYVRIYSGLTGLRIGGELSDHVNGNRFGFRLAAGDLDRDGTSDLVVSIVRRSTSSLPGELQAYSLRTLQRLAAFTIMGDSPADLLGYSLANAGDLNGDGTPDFIATSPVQSIGYSLVISGAHTPLACDRHTVSRATGGTFQFRIEAGAAHAGRLYVLAGSMTGTSPCLQLGSACLPLVVDDYTRLSLGGLFLNGIGILSASGSSTANLVVPRGVWPLALRVHHAFVVMHFGSGAMASNPVPLSGVQ